MSRKPTSGSLRRRWLRLSAALFAVALASGTTTEDAERLESRRHKIELLSQSELNRLKRNYENYLKLSPERREQLFLLHDALEQDTKNGGHLQKLLNDYNRWFIKLSPFDREKLLSTADPGERAQLVQKLREEQQKQRVLRVSRIPLVPFFGGRLDEAVGPLSSSQLDTVLGAVEQNYLREETKKRVPRVVASRERHLQIVRLTMEQLRREREAGTKMSPRETALVDTLLDAIPNEALKTRITSSGVPQQIRRQLGQVVGRSVLAEWKAEIDEVPATSAQIEETTNRWLAAAPAEKRDAMQERLQSQNGRRWFAVVAALQTNPRLKRQRQAIFWLFRGMPTPPGNRPGGAPAKPSMSTTEGAEKDSSSTESN
jgi:hypothetical protein